MLKSPELPKGVKSMKIESKLADGQTYYYLSQARTFPSIAKMISFYRFQRFKNLSFFVVVAEIS